MSLTRIAVWARIVGTLVRTSIATATFVTVVGVLYTVELADHARG